MKTVILLTILLSSSLWSATVYKTPPVIVEHTPLYCSDYYGENIEIRLVGDVVDGQIVVDRCGYTKEIAMQKQNNMQAVHNRTTDNIAKYILYIVIGMMICGLLVLVGILYISTVDDNE